MRGGYLLRFNNVKSLLSDLIKVHYDDTVMIFGFDYFNLTFKARYYDNVMIFGFCYPDPDMILQE